MEEMLIKTYKWRILQISIFESIEGVQHLKILIILNNKNDSYNYYLIKMAELDALSLYRKFRVLSKNDDDIFRIKYVVTDDKSLKKEEDSSSK